MAKKKKRIEVCSSCFTPVAHLGKCKCYKVVKTKQDTVSPIEWIKRILGKF